MACKPKPVVVECFFDDDIIDITSFMTGDEVEVASLNINLDKLCLGCTNVLEFSSNILYDTVQDSRLRLNFTLFRQCLGENNEDAVELGTWFYKRELLAGDNTSLITEDTFTFKFCDKNFCCECCRYFVVMNIDFLGEGINNATIRNIALSSIAQ